MRRAPQAPQGCGGGDLSAPETVDDDECTVPPRVSEACHTYLYGRLHLQLTSFFPATDRATATDRRHHAFHVHGNLQARPPQPCRRVVQLRCDGACVAARSQRWQVATAFFPWVLAAPRAPSAPIRDNPRHEAIYSAPWRRLTPRDWVLIREVGRKAARSTVGARPFRSPRKRARHFFAAPYRHTPPRDRGSGARYASVSPACIYSSANRERRGARRRGGGLAARGRRLEVKLGWAARNI